MPFLDVSGTRENLTKTLWFIFGPIECWVLFPESIFFTMLNLDQFRFHSYQTSLSCYILKLGFQEAPKLLGP